ncbi:MAG TPA: enoyl-CoA hydratase/isomerase family protein [Vicinamibacteria bacterium]|jgi:cyclohexa-1,5-dienecarbonyl-CoA hydratase
MADLLDDPHDADVYGTAARRLEGARYIGFDTAQGITRLTLNRPPANVLSVEMLEEVRSALEALEYQKEVKLLVVAAQGKYFSAGFELGDHLGDRAYVMLEAFRAIVEHLHRLDKPSLGVVAGPALGAGCTLATSCDVVLAAQSARLGHPEIKGGVFNPVATALLPRLVGRKKAYELILGGGALTAADAERAGLITRAVPDEKLETEVAALVERFKEGSAPILQCTRRAIAGGLDRPLTEAIDHGEDVYLNQLMGVEDFEEGLSAVMGRRKPAWKDR